MLEELEAAGQMMGDEVMLRDTFLRGLADALGELT
jgi:hypothetical protein